jgi:mannosyltransferase
VSAQAETPSPVGGLVAWVGRVLASGERVLPFLGPAIALALGAVALANRPLDTDEAGAVAAARGSFTDVVEGALSDDPARAGYLTLLRPVVAWNDSEYALRLPSVLAAVLAAVAAYRLGRRIAGPRAGAAASIVLATSVGVVGLSRTAGPLALALAAMLLSSALFARAVERGNAIWWAVYALSAAFLPLTHPIAATALAAHLAALAIGRREIDLRLALPAVGVAVLECGLFLAAGILDRADAADGAGPLELADIGIGVGRGLGWSPAVAALAVWGLVELHRRSGERFGDWRVALVGGLLVMPLVAVLVAGVALPVYPREALTVAAGGAALASGVGVTAIPDRALRLAAAAAVAAVAVAAMVTAALREPQEDWRAAARIVRAGATPHSSVVVLPTRSRPALEYYAPDLPVQLAGRGEAVTVVVAGDPSLAASVARRVVSPPRYALLESQTAGTRRVVQRWVRP